MTDPKMKAQVTALVEALRAPGPLDPARVEKMLGRRATLESSDEFYDAYDFPPHEAETAFPTAKLRWSSRKRVGLLVVSVVADPDITMEDIMPDLGGLDGPYPLMPHAQDPSPLYTVAYEPPSGELRFALTDLKPVGGIREIILDQWGRTAKNRSPACWPHGEKKKGHEGHDHR